MKARIILALAGVATLNVGCVVVSLHSTRPVRLKATRYATGAPMKNAPVEISYSYIGYGVYFVLRTPKVVTSTTDANGVAIVPMADYRGRINIKIGKSNFGTRDDVLVRKGGIIGSGDGHQVELTPMK
jgi:hypothetical protein